MSHRPFTGPGAKSHPDAEDPLVLAVDEYLRLVESGERIDAEEFVKRYPDLGVELRDCLEALDIVSQVAPDVDGPRSSEDQASKKTTVGDYRIVREIGRGGMGVVYEAEQLSLGRSVALKVLPYAAVMDQKAVIRFKNEARAAATLDHPHIVPVYAVGQERGIYFYAMSLIDGLTVAELIESLQSSVLQQPERTTSPLSIDELIENRSKNEPSSISHHEPTLASDEQTRRSESEGSSHHGETDPDIQAAISTHRSCFNTRFLRSIARLGAEAAEALDHAHQHGIVHRDIKPGNLMIDGSSKLWITDFGLARIEGDAGMTMTGDLIGTLRYMAPEQSLAKRIVVDHRADIYALGASLYELLALRPVFDGHSREALLKQIAFEEPQPLRKLNSAVPRDLETIVHKSISKNPDDRYATAAEMANDLRAFTDDQPIKARPLSYSQRATRWVSKRKGLALAATCVLILATVGLGVSTAVITHERNVAREAESEERLQRQEADRLRKLADANAKSARDAVDTFFTKISRDRLLNAPAMQPLRKELLELARGYYQDLSQQQPSTPELRLDLAEANLFLANISLMMGDIDEAVEPSATATKILKVMVAEGQATSKVRRRLADSHELAGRVYISRNQRQDAEVAYERALAIYESLVEMEPDNPKHRFRLSETYNNATVLVVGKRQELMELQDKSMAIMDELVAEYPEELDYQYSSARYLYNRAVAMASAEGLQGTIDDARKAIDILNRLVENESAGIKDQELLANCFTLVGSRVRLLGRNKEAIEYMEKGLAVTATIARENPAVFDFQRRLASARTTLAQTYVGLNLNAEAAANLARSAIEQYEEFNERYPGKHVHRLAESHLLLAISLSQKGEFERAESHFQSAERLFGQPGLANAVPTHRQLATLYYRQGQMLSELGRLSEAIRTLEKAVAQQERLRELRPKTPDFQRPLGYSNLAALWIQVGQFETAQSLLKEGLERFEKLASRFPNIQSNNTNLVMFGENAASLAEYLGDVETATELREKSVIHSGRLMGRLPVNRKLLWKNDVALGHLYKLQNRGDEAQERLQGVVETMNQIPINRRVAPALLGAAYYWMGEWAEAKQASEEVIRRQADSGPTCRATVCWWVLAMANHRLGDEKTARSYYEILTAEMTENPGLRHVDNRLYQKRLAELLGEAPKPFPKPTEVSQSDVSATAGSAAEQ